MISHVDIIDWDINDYTPLDKYPKDESNPIVGKCRKCGIELRRIMWYCCMDSSCPIQKNKPRL